MNVSITGSEGFVGKAVVSLFSKNHTVRVLDRKTENLLDSNSLVSFVSNADVIIHLAGLNRADNVNLLKVNVEGTHSLLNAVVKSNNRHVKFLFASSSQVYWPESYYGFTKKKAEEVIEKFSKKESIKSYPLRMTNVYGPNGKPFYNSAVASFIHLIKKGENVVIFGDGKRNYDLVFVDDVANAFLLAAQTDIKDEFKIYDICSGKTITVNHIAKTLIKISRKEISIVYEQNNVVYNDVKIILPVEAYNDFRWKPLVDIEEGLRLAYDKTE